MHTLALDWINFNDDYKKKKEKGRSWIKMQFIDSLKRAGVFSNDVYKD